MANTQSQQPPQADWEKAVEALLHGINSGGAFSELPPASLPAPKKTEGAGADLPTRIGQLAVKQQAEVTGGVFNGSFWREFLGGFWADVKVYGFLMLLAAIGLYGLFAPGVNVSLGGALEAPSKLAKKVKS